jgi:hypothetical protein
MKLIAHILLFIFIAFLSTPAIVGMIDKSCDTSIFYSLSEEEHTHKEVKVFNYYSNVDLGLLALEHNKSSLILSENLSKHDKIAATIFSPPPNLA